VQSLVPLRDGRFLYAWIFPFRNLNQAKWLNDMKEELEW